MFNNKLSSTFVFFVCLIALTYADVPQTRSNESNGEITFTECLVISKVSSGGRVPIHRDAIEKMLVEGTWKQPKANDIVKNFAGEERKWEKVKATKPGEFQDDRMRGYAYMTCKLDAPRIMILQANYHSMVYVNGEPRMGDVYGYNWTQIPVKLKKGLNEFLFLAFRGGLTAKLVPPSGDAFFTKTDNTLPDLVVGEKLDCQGAAIVVNATENSMNDLIISAFHGKHNITHSTVPEIPALSIRKVPFRVEGEALQTAGDYEVKLVLGKHANHEYQYYGISKLKLNVKNPGQPRKITFKSKIDGSIQYYALNPASPISGSDNAPALVLSCHGASVEAAGQARSYASKSWANIVCPTNRRPFGFDWEDWGRLDAIEVLELAQNTLNTDPQRVYLTGHSMGGHGTWHIGATYPDRFAAIAPSAGWISFWSYAGSGEVENPTPIQEILMRPTNPSRTLEIGRNYQQNGIYILHGTDDDNVPVTQARDMVKYLSGFHKNFRFHEEPGVKHWWDKRKDVPGADCVDWSPMFDFFAKNRLPKNSEVTHVEFHTAMPGISAKCHWISIEAQQTEYSFSSIDVDLEPSTKTLSGTTKNVRRLKVDVSHLPKESSLKVALDGSVIENVKVDSENSELWLERDEAGWKVISNPGASYKNSKRYGTFRDAFRNNMIFVYGTQGTKEENEWAFAKARYDAEQFWYRGNGAIDVVADTQFNSAMNSDRNIILYGNADTNSQWKPLLGESPVNVVNGSVKIGDRTIEGKDKACLLVRPNPANDTALIAAVSGTGVVGMKLCDRLPYFVSGVGYTDLMVFGTDVLETGSEAIDVAGFFGMDWSIESAEFIFKATKKD